MVEETDLKHLVLWVEGTAHKVGDLFHLKFIRV